MHKHTHTAGFDRIAPTQAKHRHADRQAANRETEVGDEEEKKERKKKEREKAREGDGDGGEGRNKVKENKKGMKMR